MKVILESSLDVWGERAELELEADSTLRDLLEDMSAKTGFPIIDRDTGEPDSVLIVLLNGQEYCWLPQRLDTALRSGDTVHIMPVAVGGG